MKYLITVEGNVDHASPVVKLFIELLGVENVSVEYSALGALLFGVPTYWFKVTSRKIEE